MTDNLAGIEKASLYIFLFEPGISLEDRFKANPEISLGIEEREEILREISNEIKP